MRLLALLALLIALPADAARIPEAAYQHKAFALAVWRDTLGQHAPTATLAAQVHKESTWRRDARSPVGAHGLAQFMPGTAADLCARVPSLRPCDTGDPRWSLRAQAEYMRHVMRPAASEWDQWALGLSAYNGGLGWTNRDRAECRAATCCDPDRWFGHVELYHGPSPRGMRRSLASQRENRQYVDRILIGIGPAYERAGWGRHVRPE